jgi:ABC-type antimicrobial peptide transport system permease subunit
MRLVKGSCFTGIDPPDVMIIHETMARRAFGDRNPIGQRIGSQRTKEIGIRMALGAQRAIVVSMVVRQGMAIGLWCIAAGLGGAYGLTRLMGSLLYGVAPNDAATFGVVAITLASTRCAGLLGTASKAALVDPLVALRHD